MSEWIAILVSLQLAAWILFYWIAIRPFFNDHDTGSSATASHWDR